MMWKVFQFELFKNGQFWISSFFVGNVISGICFGILGQGHEALGTNFKSQYFTQVFSGN